MFAECYLEKMPNDRKPGPNENDFPIRWEVPGSFDTNAECAAFVDGVAAVLNYMVSIKEEQPSEQSARIVA